MPLKNVFNPFFHLLFPCCLDFECNQISLESGAGRLRWRALKGEGSNVSVDFNEQRRRRRQHAAFGECLALCLVCSRASLHFAVRCPDGRLRATGAGSNPSAELELFQLLVTLPFI